MKNFYFIYFFVSGKFLSFEAKRGNGLSSFVLIIIRFFVCFAFFLARFSYRKALIIDFRRKEEPLKGSKCERLIGLL